jgi:hypothetical protein
MCTAILQGQGRQGGAAAASEHVVAPAAGGGEFPLPGMPCCNLCQQPPAAATANTTTTRTTPKAPTPAEGLIALAVAGEANLLSHVHAILQGTRLCSSGRGKTEEEMAGI